MGVPPPPGMGPPFCSLTRTCDSDSVVLFCADFHFAALKKSVTCSVRLQMAVVSSSPWVMNCSRLRRTEKRKQRKHHQLAKLIKVINTSAILFIVIPELTKFRTNKCLGHLHIFRIPLSRQNSRDRCNT